MKRHAKPKSRQIPSKARRRPKGRSRKGWLASFLNILKNCLTIISSLLTLLGFQANKTNAQPALPTPLETSQQCVPPSDNRLRVPNNRSLAEGMPPEAERILARLKGELLSGMSRGQAKGNALQAIAQAEREGLLGGGAQVQRLRRAVEKIIKDSPPGFNNPAFPSAKA